MSIQLIVQADDYGMCASVTDGILAAHLSGSVTQASIMVPAPDARRAMWLAGRQGLPLGVHLVLACEWEYWRYYPLTAASSLRVDDGAFPPGIAELRQQADPAEVVAELEAQVAAVRLAGIEPTHVESHVRVYDPTVLARLAARWGVWCRDELSPPVDPPLTTLWHLSTRPPSSKLADLLAHVRSLPDGLHMIVAHPAVDGPELQTLCRPDSRRWRWAREVRVTDLMALTDRAFATTCAEQGVELVSLATLRVP
ncbi:carbohydrate deacetylase [Plantactinospora soyae]|uniref:Glycoside hydrolase/deacetylase ChbG (UPF0249 family) n=1 Tax=Plantactinospora soyae TaxID=1544732 RepID=A0A927M9F7_9ACTN|nr:ChbG/HpnK family deacetylase [Plantactinospora soyae]MBE1489522.1 putative glycoside hydrolase/deacetylase ChbG (UPF0249 family) [Plantactinospora soyae]